MVIYADVLVILNIYINFFLIKSAALLMRRKVSSARCLAGALIGGFGALIILLPELPFIVTALEKILLGSLIVFVVFGRQKPADFAVCTLFFLIVSFSYAGIMLALWTFAAPYGMVYGNGVAGFDIPLAAVAAFTVTGYCAVKLVRYIADSRIRCNRICVVKISAGGTEKTLRGLSDTGNALCDIFSGKPVVICDADKITEITPQNVIDYLNGKAPEGIRLIPCKTVSAQMLLPIFKAETVTVDGKTADALIGVSSKPLGSDIDCIFNPKIISF